ncbi:MAG: rRNA maturation RNase YbeY [Candidatus Tectomicrobia bacterium]|nr:rRNA maturation RNase YbeY [Candidatus Tectomicrobia bacterium]
MPVLIQNRQRKVRLDRRQARRDLEAALRAVSCPDAELSLCYVGERRMRELNRRYRGLDRVTDVLSFPLRAETPEPAGELAPRLLGDVVVAPGVAARQALERGHSLAQELLLLEIHGLLHLLGYDHEVSQAEARRMRREEQRVLRSVGAERAR